MISEASYTRYQRNRSKAWLIGLANGAGKLLTSSAFLIVDDEPLARMELAQVVRDCGYEPWEAANSEEALSILEASGHAFAGLITDINMPGLRTGIFLAKHVRSTWPHIEIIVVSGAGVPLEEGLPDRIEILIKPVLPSRLIEAIRGSVQT